jgi:hypothetical protein
MLRYAIALRELAILGWRTRFRRRGAYWTWRMETAFGHDASRMPDAAARREAIIDYANWVAAMKRIRPR